MLLGVPLLFFPCLIHRCQFFWGFQSDAISANSFDVKFETFLDETSGERVIRERRWVLRLVRKDIFTFHSLRSSFLQYQNSIRKKPEPKAQPKVQTSNSSNRGKLVKSKIWSNFQVKLSHPFKAQHSLPSIRRSICWFFKSSLVTSLIKVSTLSAEEAFFEMERKADEIDEGCSQAKAFALSGNSNRSREIRSKAQCSVYRCVRCFS